MEADRPRTADHREKTSGVPLRAKREYQSWVAKETLEDYALRYAARSFRRWSPFTVANTAIGGISFLALEAIGASITVAYGFQNAVPAILVVCVLIFLVTIPISYYSSVANVDIDLLTRGAGFGFIGSTVTSLIYASFTFIFFAIEAAIMAQALELALGMNIIIGYLLSSLVIIPIVFFGVTLINKLQMWTQPLWVVLLVAPFAFVLHQDPGVLSAWAEYGGNLGADGRFNALYFGAASGVLFALVVQVGEQTDYLRFLPNKNPDNRLAWWTAMFSAGPGWIVVGGLKILAGSLLGYMVIRAGGAVHEAVVPINMYIKAYEYLFEPAAAVVAVAAVFVVISQIKINVTNAYSGSLAWSNCFARLAHYHPGRVVWLVFNVLIALLLSLMGIFATLEAVLSVYSSVAIAWIGALVADLVILKPAGISPPYIEFKRAHLYNFNPVGCGATLIGSAISVLAYAGAFGAVPRAYFAFLALGTAAIAAIVIAYATRGRYYIARPDLHFRDRTSDRMVRCCICERQYEAPDMADCPFYRGPICSLCCGLENHCHDACKKPRGEVDKDAVADGAAQGGFKQHLGRRVGRFLGLFSIVAVVLASVFLLTYRLVDLPGNAGSSDTELVNLLVRLYLGTLVVSAVGTWWIVLSQESRELTAQELLQSLHHLEVTRRDLVQSEKLALLGGLVAGVAHEINNPVGITVSAASYLKDRTDGIQRAQAEGKVTDDEIREYLRDAAQSARLLSSNAQRAAQLVQSFKQVAVDQASEERRRFDLRAYIDEALLSLRPKLKEANVTVRVDCPRGLELTTYPGALAQVLTNLVLNSLQHAFDGRPEGEIRIAAQPDGDQFVRIRFEDNGAGIPAEMADKVFEPFFTTRRGVGGSGLGLYLVYNLVTHSLNGSIALDTGMTEGAAFEVRIPRVNEIRSNLAKVLWVTPRSGSRE